MTDQANEVDVLEQSDEDFLNSSQPQEDYTPPTEEPQDDPEETETVESDTPDPVDESEENTSEQVVEGGEDENDEDDANDAAGNREAESEIKEEPKAEKGNEAESENSFKPVTLKVKGKEVEVKTAEEAIRLMQQGLDYSNKSAQLKKHKRIIQTLERSNVDNDKLNLALEVLQGKPEAIAKLVQQHNLQEHNFFEETQYQPNDHLVSENEVAVREAFEEIQTSPHYQSVVDVVSTKWDDRSANEFVKNPQYILALEEQMANGTYDKVVALMERERAINGSAVSHLSDLELYSAIGSELAKQGHLAPPTQGAVEKVVAPKPRKQKTVNRTDASKVAPTVKQSANVVQQVNWLDLPDDQVK